MRCNRCFKSKDVGEHGHNLCPYEPRRFAPVVRPDSIPGGLVIEHGLCNADGSPRRFDSHSEIRQACAVKGLVPWGHVYEESRTKDARVRADWMQSGEAQRAKADRDEQRRARR
jgi:hypothetical protein